MEEALVALLKTQVSITATVGQRIYAGFMPQKAVSHTNDDDRDGLPCILITELSSEENVAFDSTGALRFVNVDIDCKAKSRPVARTLAKTVRRFIDDYTGTAGSETIRAVLMEASRMDYEQPFDGSDNGIHVVTMNLTVQYEES